MVDFNRFGLHAELTRAIAELEFTSPTPIQSDAIPYALAGRDLLACASTGSGKTAAFLLPIIERLRKQPRGGTRALVITPTRELAAQIVEHAAALAKHTRVRAAAIHGGVNMGRQADALRRGVDIVVATPGRLLDHMRYDYTNFSKLEVLVLDEADRMLDMGFLPDIRRVLRGLPTTPRQTLFFSATMPAAVAELSRDLLRDPARINIERKAAPAAGITQVLYPVPQKLKAALLIELLQRREIGNVIVFTRTKHRANRLWEKIERAGISSARIHGNRSQAQRTDALAGFKDGRYQVLAATDIVARGIDVEALDHVVNFDVPAAPEDYIHRVGRTARAEATGEAYTFVSPDEEGDVRQIERVLGKRIDRRKLAGFDYTARAQDRFEVPIEERIAEIRARKADERARRRAKEQAAAGQPAAEQRATPSGEGSGRRRRRSGRGRRG
jgi:ATP-dependent RNA helicase RhlE